MNKARAFTVCLIGALLAGAAPTDPAALCRATLPGWDSATLRIEVQGDTLLVQGRIDDNLPGHLESSLARHPDVVTIHFNASGDDRASAMAAGLILRAAGNFEAHVPAGANCTDACALLFLSGRIRSVDPAAVFDIGEFYQTPGSASNADVARQSLAIANYLIRMGVSRRLLTDALDRDAELPPGAARPCLTRTELHSYNVANWNE